MTHLEKELYVSRYDTNIYNKKTNKRFYKHVQHFLKYQSDDDEVIAEILDYMYSVIIVANKAVDGSKKRLFKE